MEIEGWEVGVLASLSGSFLGTLGGQLRMTALTEENASRRYYFFTVLGWSCWLGGQGLGQVAILMAPATVAACVGFSGSLLFNALLAPCVLGERLSMLHGVGIALLSLGGISVTLCSSHTDEHFTWDELSEILRRWSSLCLLGGLLAVGLAVLMRSCFRKSGMDLGSFAYVFALCGAVDLLVTKVALTMLRLKARAEEAEEDDAALLGSAPPGSVVTTFIVIMVLAHLLSFQSQLKSTYYGESLKNLPIFLGSGAMMQVLLAGNFFGEFDGFGARRITAFAIGFIMMLAGMLVTSNAATDQGTKELPPAQLPRPHFCTFERPALQGGRGPMDLVFTARFQEIQMVTGRRRKHRRVVSMPNLYGTDPFEDDDLSEGLMGAGDGGRRCGMGRVVTMPAMPRSDSDAGAEPLSERFRDAGSDRAAAAAAPATMPARVPQLAAARAVTFK